MGLVGWEGFVGYPMPNPAKKSILKIEIRVHSFARCKYFDRFPDSRTCVCHNAVGTNDNSSENNQLFSPLLYGRIKSRLECTFSEAIFARDYTKLATQKSSPRFALILFPELYIFPGYLWRSYLFFNADFSPLSFSAHIWTRTWKLFRRDGNLAAKVTKLGLENLNALLLLSRKSQNRRKGPTSYIGPVNITHSSNPGSISRYFRPTLETRKKRNLHGRKKNCPW